MDPIAHTLVGATMAQTGLRKLTPLATATLLIGVNLPDIDGVMSFFGADDSLYYRRGITHGILAQLLLPILLTLVMLAYDRFVRRRHDATLPPVRPVPLLLLAYLAVLSHPFLDWLNTYGVRLLMPFSGRWFYGDTLFIIDAWMWLLMGAAAVFAYSQTRWSQRLWVGLGLATSTLVTAVEFVPVPAKILWWLGIVVIVAVRIRGISMARNAVIAMGCLLAFGLYLAAMAAGNRVAQNKAEDWLSQQYGAVLTDVMTGPIAANPFYRELILVTATHYYGLRVPLLQSGSLEQIFEPTPIQKPDAIIKKALAMPDIRGFVNWMRFPIYEVEPLAGGYRVVIRDLRYVRPGQQAGAGIGMAETFVPREALE